jgi:glycosyltransferase involved in cell wall biosynthesis
MMALDRPESGFRVCGSAPDQYAALARHRVNLAPLRFGAGIKGKISDGWLVGTPAVATSIGAEGMGDDEAPWGGRVADSVEDFAQAAAALYQEENLWRQCSDAGKRILRARFGRAEGERRLFESLEAAIDDLAGSRERNVVGAMLRHQLHRSTEYFSRWIEAKNLHVRGP